MKDCMHQSDELRFVFRNKMPGEDLGVLWSSRQEVKRPELIREGLSKNIPSVSCFIPSVSASAKRSGASRRNNLCNG